MALERILLGMLLQQPAHGYRLWQRINATLGELRPIQASHVYATVAALERDGLLEARTEPDGRGGTRRVLAPTASGAAAYQSWIASTASRESLLRRPLLLKAAVAVHLGERLAVALTNAERLARRRLLQILREGESRSCVSALLCRRAAGQIAVELWLLDELAESSAPTTRRSASGSR